MAFSIPAVSFADEPNDTPIEITDATAAITPESAELAGTAAIPESTSGPDVANEPAEPANAQLINVVQGDDAPAGPTAPAVVIADDPTPALDDPEPLATPAPATPAVEEKPLGAPAVEAEPSTTPAPAPAVEEKPQVTTEPAEEEAPLMASSSAAEEEPLAAASSNDCTVYYTINFDVTGTLASYFDSKTMHSYLETIWPSTSGTWSDGTTGIRSFTGTITVNPETAMYSHPQIGFPVTTYSANDVTHPQYTLRQWEIASWSLEENNYGGLYYSDTWFHYAPGSSMEHVSAWVGASTTFYMYSRDASSARHIWEMYVMDGGDDSNPPSDYVAWVDASSNVSWQSAGINIFYSSPLHITINLVPEWTPAVVFDFNDGEGTLLNRYGYTLTNNYDLQINKAMKIVVPQASLTRDGYVQTGWNSDPNGGGAHYTPLQEIQVDRNLTLYAEWDANASYSVLYWMGAADSGSLPASSGVSADGHTATIQPNNLVRNGYIANGWNTKGDASGTHYSAGDTIELTSNLVLVPEWIRNSYNVYFSTNGGSGSMDSMLITYGSPQALRKNTFTRGSYDFVGWSRSSSATVATYTDEQVVDIADSSGYVYLYAIWRPVSLSFSYDTGGGTGTYEGVTGLSASSVIDIPTETPSKAGYLFDGWFFDNASTDESVKATPGITAGEVAGLSSSDTYTLTAHFAEIPYSITYDFNGATGGLVSARLAIAGSGQRTVAPNTLVRGNATAAGWNTQANGGGIAYSGGEILDLDSNLTLYAQFVDSSGALLSAASVGESSDSAGYTVSYDLNGGSGSLVDCGAVSSDGLTAALASNSMTRAGYRANGWNTKADGTGTAYTDAEVISLDGDLVLYAAWIAVANDDPGTSDEKTGDEGSGSATKGGSSNTGKGAASSSQDTTAQSDDVSSNANGGTGATSGNSAFGSTAVMGFAGIAPFTAEPSAEEQASTNSGVLNGFNIDALSKLLSIASPEKAYAASAEVSATNGLNEAKQSSETGDKAATNDSGTNLVLILAGVLALIALTVLGLLLFNRKKDRSDA